MPSTKTDTSAQAPETPLTLERRGAWVVLHDAINDVHVVFRPKDEQDAEGNSEPYFLGDDGFNDYAAQKLARYGSTASAADVKAALS